MPRYEPTDHFIKKRVDVDDSDRSMTFGPGRARRGGPFDPGAENLYVLGLAGSGRRALAEAAARKLGLAFADLTGEAATSQALDELLASHGRVAALGRAALDHPAMQKALAASRAYFLLADLPLLMERLGRDESLRQRLLADLADLEPRAMALSRHTLRASKDVDELLADLEMTLAMPL